MRRRKVRTLRIVFWNTILISMLSAPQIHAQFLYGTAGKASLQTATLENVMLLQNVRDVDYNCQACQGWFTGYGSGGYAEGTSYSTTTPRTLYDAEYSQETGGFLTGFDRSLSETCRSGLFFAYNSNVLDETSVNPVVTSNQHLDMNNYFWGGSGRKDFQHCYLLGTLAGGYTRLNESVTYTPQILPNDTMQNNSWRALAYGEVGQEYLVGQTLVQPFWGLQYFYSGYDEAEFYDENGDLALRLENLDTNSLRNVLGLRIARDLYRTEDGFIKLDCIGFWYHEFLGREDLGVAKVVGSNQIAEAVWSGRDWAVIAPTLNFKYKNLRMWAGYIVMFNENEAINLGQGGLAYCF